MCNLRSRMQKRTNAHWKKNIENCVACHRLTEKCESHERWKSLKIGFLHCETVRFAAKENKDLWLMNYEHQDYGYYGLPQLQCQIHVMQPWLAASSRKQSKTHICPFTGRLGGWGGGEDTRIEPASCICSMEFRSWITRQALTDMIP